MSKEELRWALGLVALLAAFVGWGFGKIFTRYEDDKLCRHTIQRSFGKTKAEAEALMVETQAWERE